MEDVALSMLYEMDKGTISQTDSIELLAAIAKLGKEYRPYRDRAGPALSVVSTEIKREMDNTITPLLAEKLGKLTSNRFHEVYCDVRVYPEGEELAIWQNDAWADKVLNVLVSFVIGVPADDKLDSLTRINLISLFSESPDAQFEDELEDPFLFKKLLNVDVVSTLMGEMRMDYFSPPDFAGMSLEIMFDACRHADFAKLSEAAKGEPIQLARSTRDKPKAPSTSITLENYEFETLNLISAIARELGVETLDPSKLKRIDSLFALMGFDHAKTLSLTKSVQMHFDVLDIIGSERMVTVGNIVDFVGDTIAFRES